MKYCQKCGKEIMDEAVICISCGCSVLPAAHIQQAVEPNALLQKLSQRLHTNAIIWLVIGILQILSGIAFNWVVLIVGVLNIISSVKDMNYSKEVLRNSSGIVANFTPVAGPIIVLIYNLLIGGIIGVIGSIYYFVGLRGFVLENRTAFEQMEVGII